MKIADTLTTKSDFALYITDANFDNFAVDKSGKVTVIDLENIIVVDKLAIEASELYRFITLLSVVRRFLSLFFSTNAHG